MHGFYRIAAAVPKLRVADVEFNVDQILALIRKAKRNHAALITFPELCLTGYTCGDLFHQSRLLDAANAAVLAICSKTKNSNLIIILGTPMMINGFLYNCAVILQKGTVCGVVPKSYLANYREFYEKRWFSSGIDQAGKEIVVGKQKVPFGTDLIFEVDDDLKIGVELCEDLWNVIPPSCYYALAGANVLVNLSASNELVAKAVYRRELIKNQSARCVAAYAYASCGVLESTTDLVYGGHAVVAENGTVVEENNRFERESEIIYADIDCRRLLMTRMSETSMSDTPPPNYRTATLQPVPQPAELRRTIERFPFVPGDPEKRTERCQEIFNIQTAGLAKRLEHTQAKSAVIGVSGGLDSTWALLVAREAFAKIDMDIENLITVTMPGFGTSSRTYSNAVKLCCVLGTMFRDINITKSCKQHFSDIDHDPKNEDVTFENVQARERTQILMNLANKHHGIVIGTGDLSEIALGWSTYSGDHISMYAVNCGVPKTLIRYLIKWVADHSNRDLKGILKAVLETPISPELTSASEADEINQKTEELIGPYALHDFFLYHHIKYGAPPDKIKFLANIAFRGEYKKEEIEKWLSVFLKRFFDNQFKRSCIPDGPKVGTISLSPRGDWRMPSDASGALWLKDD